MKLDATGRSWMQQPRGLRHASRDLAAGRVQLTTGASLPLEEAETTVKRAAPGLGGALVLEP
jgi:hypothetical protein